MGQGVHQRLPGLPHDLPQLFVRYFERHHVLPAQATVSYARAG